jgi:hypothetical protein
MSEADIVERLREAWDTEAYGRSLFDEAADEIERLRALMPPDPRIAQLEKDGAALSAWQCIHMDGKTGITSDDHGNQYCAKDRRIAQLEAENERLKSYLGTYEAGVNSITSPYSPRWTGETVRAFDADHAALLFENKGYYRNLVVRSVPVPEGE